MILLAVAALLLPFAVLAGVEQIHPLARELGMTNGSGEPYLFWSGFFSDATIFVAAVVFTARHNCHARWCPRVGRHAVAGTPYVTCRQHHPAGITSRPTASEIARAHAEVSSGA